PTALWGGVAIVLGTAAGLAVATRFADDAWAGDAASLRTSPVFGVVLSAVFMFGAGLVDDMVRLKPQAKFLLQLVAGVILLSLGGVFAGGRVEESHHGAVRAAGDRRGTAARHQAGHGHPPARGPSDLRGRARSQHLPADRVGTVRAPGGAAVLRIRGRRWHRG